MKLVSVFTLRVPPGAFFMAERQNAGVEFSVSGLHPAFPVHGLEEMNLPE